MSTNLLSSEGKRKSPDKEWGCAGMHKCTVYGRGRREGGGRERGGVRWDRKQRERLEARKEEMEGEAVSYDSTDDSAYFALVVLRCTSLAPSLFDPCLRFFRFASLLLPLFSVCVCG